MAIDPETLKAWPFPPLTRCYDEKDTILYALGLGIGQDPLDPRQLPFVYEEGLRTLPTMAAVLGFPGPFLSDPATGIDYSKVVHGEQHLEVVRPLPIAGEMHCLNRVVAVQDKGEGRGAAVTVARELYDKADGSLVSRQSSVLIARGDGGFGGPLSASTTPQLAKTPDRDPDEGFEWSVPAQLALVYRLSGDMNPLHADPERARQAGFAKPILHGLASFGIAAYAATVTVCDGDPDRLREIGVRFSGPVIPGDTLDFQFWRLSESEVSFRAHARERDRVVLDNGRIRHA